MNNKNTMEKTDATIKLNPSTYYKQHSSDSQIKLFKCPNYCVPDNLVIKEIKTGSFVAIQCDSCEVGWYVCHNCPHQSKHYLTSAQLKRHFYTTCKNKANRRLNDSSTKIRRVASTECIPINTSTIVQFVDFEKLSLFGCLRNKIYYFYEQFNQGPHYIVGLSQYNLNNIAALLDTSEVYCHIRLAYLFLTQNPTQCEMTTCVLQYLHPHLSPSFFRRRWACTLPLDLATMRRCYTEGKNSIMNNIPYPNILDVDHHSYVPLTEVIQDCLANDHNVCDLNKCVLEPDNINNRVEKIWESRIATEIIEKIRETNDPDDETMHLILLSWSDDFEPNNIKQNKSGNSIWTFTVTIISEMSFNQSEENTYIISLGPKNADHSNIEKRFYADLDDINGDTEKYFYVASKRKLVKVKLHLIGCIADLPERCDRCKISRGNSNNTTRWGYVSNVNVLNKYLPSCKKCFKYNIKSNKLNNHKRKSKCTICMNWSFDNTNGLSSYKPPKGYPKDENCFELTTHKIDFSVLSYVCQKAERKLISKEWTCNEVTTYLAQHGIQQSLIDEINRQKDVQYELISEHPIEYDPTRHRNNINPLIKAYTLSQHPKDYVPTPLPPSWENSNIRIGHWMDAPMHLLFLGVVKKTNRILDKWSTMFMKRKPMMESFAAMVPYLSNMRLEWLKILPLCENLTFGGYVSENWVAVSRLSCWFYSCVPKIIPNTTIETIDPSKPLTMWTGQEMRRWLVLRGLKRSGRVDELRKRIHDAKADKSKFPDIIGKYRCPTSIIRNTFVAMNVMISRLMQSICTDDSIDESRTSITLFLNCLRCWCTFATPPNKKPYWLSSYSYLNLLNIPLVMHKFGPLRNYWEGSTMGEGILKKVKANYNDLRPGWHMTLTKRTLQIRSISRIMNKMEEQKMLSTSKGKKETRSFKERSTNFYIYSELDCVQKTMNDGKPVSIIIDTDMKLHVVVTNDLLYEIEVLEYLNENFGLCYFKCKVPNQGDHTILDQQDIFDYGVMLPQLTGSNDFETMTNPLCYTIITSEWLQINKHKNFVLPTFNFEGKVDELFNDITLEQSTDQQNNERNVIDNEEEI